ncbi:MAG TPA: hypothetical protein VFJ72_02640 [Rubrobacteraceae bacterium]|nr:hypothetical protein [Rubrobacteraceae bacterium]
MRVALEREGSTIRAYMVREIENCLHLQGLRGTVGLEYRCPACEAHLDMDGVARWVREAERARDEAYSMIQGDKFGEIAREESQREVYRRRKVMYELQNIPQAVAARPEMILVIYDAAGDSYGCKIFYKEPRPVAGLEEIEIEAGWNAILELRSHPDPVVRIAAEKVEEFHGQRQAASRGEMLPPTRRVFYASEL